MAVCHPSTKKDLLAQILALNQEVSARIEKTGPVNRPGIPPKYPDLQKLISDDCIRPPR